MIFMFEMGGVVTNTWEPSSICEYLGISKDEFYKIIGNNKNGRKSPFETNLFSELTTGKIEETEFWKQFQNRAGELGIKIAKEISYNLFSSFFHPEFDQETVKIIEKLKKKHRVICGTNTIVSHYENHMERGDYSIFDQTYTSVKLRAQKPSPEFFQKILEAENPDSAESVFFVDDRKENVDAAAACGINSVLFTTAAELKKKWRKYF